MRRNPLLILLALGAGRLRLHAASARRPRTCRPSTPSAPFRRSSIRRRCCRTKRRRRNRKRCRGKRPRRSSSRPKTKSCAPRSPSPRPSPWTRSTEQDLHPRHHADVRVQGKDLLLLERGEQTRLRRQPGAVSQGRLYEALTPSSRTRAALLHPRAPAAAFSPPATDARTFRSRAASLRVASYSSYANSMLRLARLGDGRADQHFIVVADTGCGSGTGCR